MGGVYEKENSSLLGQFLVFGGNTPGGNVNETFNRAGNPAHRNLSDL